MDVICASGYIVFVKLAILFGANDWDSGLYGACRGGHLEVINLMIEKGADNWNIGLAGACDGGNIEVIYLMIEKGANNWDGGLFGACIGGHLEIVKLMIEKGADDWNKGLYYACYSRRKNNNDIIKLIIKKGGIPDIFMIIYDIECVYYCLNKGYEFNYSNLNELIRTQDPIIYLRGHISDIYLKMIRNCLY